jgi:hypothetical protein
MEQLALASLTKGAALWQQARGVSVKRIGLVVQLHARLVERGAPRSSSEKRNARLNAQRTSCAFETELFLLLARPDVLRNSCWCQRSKERSLCTASKFGYVRTRRRYLLRGPKSVVLVGLGFYVSSVDFV